MKLKFEWDENKNKKNFLKHKVSFEEARTVFDDENAFYDDDPDHSIEEMRFIVIGKSEEFEREITVCYCDRSVTDDEEIIRIISARRAEKHEIEIYLRGGLL